MTLGVAVESPDLSLIMGTFGRTRELAVFLDALAGQAHDHVELIVVDQNRDERVARLLADHAAGLTVRHLRVPWQGLSRARNFGAAAARGAILGFPDDDCHYPPGFVAGLLAWFARHPDADGLSCRVADERGRRSAGGYMSRGAHWLDRRNVWRSAVAPGLFVRRRVHEAVGGFDERLGRGSGTPFGSAEESDYLLRALAEGGRIRYEAARIVRHPPTIDRGPRLERSWSYGCGMGFALRKNGFRLHHALYFASVSFGASAMSLLGLRPGRAVSRSAMAAGRIVGFLRGARLLRTEAAGPNPVRVAASGEPARSGTP